MEHRILFLCMGNICRSPAAHCYLQHLVNEKGMADQFEIDSAGTIGYHQGSPPDARMAAALNARGIPVIGRSKQLDAFDLEYYDRILAMDRDNLAGAQSLDRRRQNLEKIQLFSDYCQQSTVIDIPDPYYGGDKGFETVIDMIEDGCDRLLQSIIAERTDRP